MFHLLIAISEINNTQIDNTKDIDIMPMCNSIEYRDTIPKHL